MPNISTEGTGQANITDSEYFANLVIRQRGELLEQLGDEYLPTIRPIMDALRAESVRRNVSVLKAYEYAATPFLVEECVTGLWLLGAAIAELYLQRFASLSHPSVEAETGAESSRERERIQ